MIYIHNKTGKEFIKVKEDPTPQGTWVYLKPLGAKPSQNPICFGKKAFAAQFRVKGEA